MPILSTDSTYVTPGAAQRELFIPFTAHVRVVPNLGTGKRTTLIRNLEKAALRAEQSILDAEDRNLMSTSVNIATPVAFTPQFGDFTGRLTIVGFVRRERDSDDRRNVAPTTDVTVIHSGTDQGEATATTDVNQGGSLAAAQDPVDVVTIEVLQLRDDLETALLSGSPGLPNFQIEDIVHIEYNGVKFGTKKIGGRSFQG